MATSYTSLLGFALPVTGELDGTWGTVVNNSITQLVEDSVAGTATQSVASGDWTLTTTGSGAANQARCAIIIPTGSPGVSRNIIAPGQSKAYVVLNQSNAAVVVKASATTGTTLIAGERAVVAWNGSDFVTVASSVTDGVATISFGTTGLLPNSATSGAVTVTGTLAVGSGGTGNTTIPARSVFVANTTDTLTTVTPTAGQSIRVNAGNTAWEAYTPSSGTGDVVGPASATDNAVARFDLTTGKLIQNSAVTIADTTGDITGGAYNKVTITPPASSATLTIANGKTLTANSSITLAGTDSKTLTVNNSLTLAGTDATTMTFPSTSATIAGLGVSQTFTALQTFAGSTSVAGMKIIDVLETVTVSATAATGTIAYDITTQAVLFYTSNASGNWTVNFRASSGTSLNTLMSTGESVTVAFLVTQGSTAYYNTTVQVDGTTSGVTTRWQGGTAPTAGNASSVDAYVYSIIKTANATFSVFASQTRFA